MSQNDAPMPAILVNAPERPPRRYVSAPGQPTEITLNKPHIATLPDGTTVNLPAGATLRENGGQ